MSDELKKKLEAQIDLLLIEMEDEFTTEKRYIELLREVNTLSEILLRANEAENNCKIEKIKQEPSAKKMAFEMCRVVAPILIELLYHHLTVKQILHFEATGTFLSATTKRIMNDLPKIWKK